ncbi:hypothetical protein L7F22_029602 [Adiantum nelumboides]|nr:hypothetical protein [Adiantum nelumboides]
MHIFKNVGHSLWQHLVGLKDTAAARNDLKDQNSKPNLWPLSDETRRETTYEPAPWVHTAEEVQTINKRIQLIRTPTGYGASCRNMFTLDDKSLFGLKTHDWHNFLKHVLPLVIDGCTTQGVRDVIYCLGLLARWITSREIDKGLIPQKKRKCIELLCLMEKELPTSFFDIQVHLLIHLVDEIELAGVVSARWMFWVERFMGVLKGYVRLKARPEGSMAEGWMLEECMYYVCEYLERTDFEAPRVWTNESSSTMSDEVILKVDWFRAEYKGNNATMRREPSKFWSIDSSKLMRATREPYILPAHVEQAFFYKNLDSHPWWQVVHVQPRGRRLFDSVDPEEANRDELPTSSNLDTSMLETCRISLADHDDIVDDTEVGNHPYSDTTDTEEEDRVDVEHVEEMNVNTDLTAEEFQEVNKDNEDEILLIVNLRDDDEE